MKLIIRRVRPTVFPFKKSLLLSLNMGIVYEMARECPCKLKIFLDN